VPSVAGGPSRTGDREPHARFAPPRFGPGAGDPCTHILGQRGEQSPPLSGPPPAPRARLPLSAAAPCAARACSSRPISVVYAASRSPIRRRAEPSAARARPSAVAGPAGVGRGVEVSGPSLAQVAGAAVGVGEVRGSMDPPGRGLARPGSPAARPPTGGPPRSSKRQPGRGLVGRPAQVGQRLRGVAQPGRLHQVSGQIRGQPGGAGGHQGLEGLCDPGVQVGAGQRVEVQVWGPRGTGRG
jgi:hypothetical protein